MLATNIPYLYCRNVIYYYRNNTVWKSLKTRCKKTAFRKLSITLFSTTPAVKDTSITVNDSSSTQPDTKTTLNYSSSTTSLIKAYLAENGDRWCAREYTRIKSALSFLPKGVISKETAIELKTSILLIKTTTTFNTIKPFFGGSAIFMLIITQIVQISVL